MSSTAVPFTVVHSWVQVEYHWPSESMKQEYLASGAYVPQSNIITGLKVYQSRVFVTVPRWRYGVPSTLNEVIVVDAITNSTNNSTNSTTAVAKDTDTQSVLSPYPSWSMQNPNDCNSFQNIQSMEIDLDGVLWIVDVGRKYFFDSNASLVDNTCPPKLVLWDIQSNTQVHAYTFPPNVANYTNSFLNDIVLDYKRNIAYMSDLLGAIPGGIVSFDYQKGISNRFEDISMKYDRNNSLAFHGRRIQINGYTIFTSNAEDGIALTPDTNFVYYCPLSSSRLYRVPAIVVRSYTSDKNQNIEFLGNRNSQMDGMTFSNTSQLYFASMHETAIVAMDFGSSVSSFREPLGNQSFNTDADVDTYMSILASDNVSLQWADTFAWDNDNEELWFTTNRLHRYFLQNMDWDGNEGHNLRIVKIHLPGQSSYMNYNASQQKKSPKDTEMQWWQITLIVASALVMVGLLLWLWSRHKLRRRNDKNEHLLLDTMT